MVFSALICSRFPSYDVVLRCRVACSASTGLEAAGAHALNQTYARAHTHTHYRKCVCWISSQEMLQRYRRISTARNAISILAGSYFVVPWCSSCRLCVCVCVCVCLCSIFGRFACVRAHTNLHGVYMWGMHLYIFRRDLRCWRRASCKAKTRQIFCSKMRLTFPLPLFVTGFADTGYACVCVFHPFAPVRHMHAWSAAMSSTCTHLNIGTGHVLALCNAPLILLVQDELNFFSCSCVVRAGLRAFVRACVDVCIKIAFGDDLTGFIGRTKFITLNIYNDAGKSAYNHKYGNCMSLMWESHLFTRAVLRNAHGYKRTQRKLTCTNNLGTGTHLLQIQMGGKSFFSSGHFLVHVLR